jgi:predicted metal-dependent peptidase
MSADRPQLAPEIMKLSDIEDRAELSRIGQRMEEGIVGLIRQKPFFGYILTRMRRIQAPHLCPTMGVRPTADKYIQLSYNPAFVNILTDAQLMSVLEHEVLHVVNEHPIRRGCRDPLVWNFACDIAINQYITGLPPDCLMVPEGLEKEREAEYYYNSEQVQEQAGQCKQNGQGHSGEGSQRGDHEGWDELDGDVSAQEKIRQMIKGAAEDAKRQGRGTMPSWLEEMIGRILQTPIKWNILLRTGISEEICPQPEETFRRPHRRRLIDVGGRQEDMYPGFKRKPQSELTCAIDTSGSMSKEDLGEILNELSHLSRAGYWPITLIVMQMSQKLKPIMVKMRL